ncbi:MAG: hypothetical protein FJZ90_07930 [Chloroflexi bacterium]|nr:hypothetical protein [Chloroflexota bacterium]
MTNSDITILRDLARAYLEICHDPGQQARRDLWRRHNGMRPTPPPIYVRAFAWQEMPQSRCLCEDPFYRQYEDGFRQSLFRSTFGDDFIFEPWVTVDAAWVIPAEGLWGVPVIWRGREYGRAGVWEAPLKEPEDLARLVAPHHVIDEEETARRLDKLGQAIGDVITINVDRAPIYRMWNADISTRIAELRGLEQLMWDMMDRPQWLHELLAFMRDGILQTHEEAERAGDWTLCDHQNQAMPYAEELEDPAANSESVTRDRLWGYAASQETTAVGPALFDAFMLQYQIPILARFGLTAYGCCEDLTHKIGLLRQIPNLRRIAVAPAADVARCAEQIGRDYVLSYRPSPADMVAYGWNEERVRSILHRDLEACRDCCVDITLKDVETVQHDPNRVRQWVRITRQVIDQVWRV